MLGSKTVATASVDECGAEEYGDETNPRGDFASVGLPALAITVGRLSIKVKVAYSECHKFEIRHCIHQNVSAFACEVVNA